MSPLPPLRGRDRVVLDTMVWIYLFEDAPRYGALCERIVRAAEGGLFRAVLTPVTAAELLVKPLAQNREDVADRYRRALRSFGNVETAAISLETGFLAGALRAKYRLPLPDMLQVACALQSATPTLLTNDRDLRRVEEVQVLLLDELLESAP